MAKKKSNKGGAREGAGRPAIHPEGAMVMLSARVPESLVNQLDERVKKTGATRSQIITDAIRAALKTPNKRRTGVSIPSAEADPSDRV